LGCIKLLDELTINQIAAGEVIERPASVVKELLENAIDAQATRIEVEIKNGGRSLIRVTDNGRGMNREDLLLSVERHATSKISAADDLNHLMTLGFRGEALPSIASVSQLEIASRARGEAGGNLIDIEAGMIKRNREAGVPEGTTVRVKDLFLNTPARLKHLKSIPTEAGYIAEIVGRLAVAYPAISFRLIHHEYEILFTPGSGDRLEAITAVFGREITREMMTIEPVNQSITVEGFLGKPSIARTTRNYELTFLNGRYIRSRIVGAAVEKAYHSLLPIARYPFSVIFLTADPAQVDVNVHPAKLEARFGDEGALFRAVYHATKKTLSLSSLVFPWQSGESEASLSGAQAAATVQDAAFSDLPRIITRTPLPFSDPQQTVLKQKEGFVCFGVSLKDTYIMAHDKDGFLLVDQHAAHERILFDRYRASAGSEIGPQRLLIPATINLSFQQARLLSERLPVFTELGFGLESFGPNTFLLRAMPAALSRMDGPRLVADLLDELLHQPAARDTRQIRETFLATMACHAAVKAGDALSPQEMQALLDDLGGTTVPYTCPHGRPTVIRLSWDEIARRFRRR